MFSGLFFFYFILFPFGTDYYDKREISGNKAFIKLCEMSYMWWYSSIHMQDYIDLQVITVEHWVFDVACRKWAYMIDKQKEL